MMLNDEQRETMVRKQRESMLLGTLIHEGDGLTPKVSQGWIGLTNLGAATRNPFGPIGTQHQGVFVYIVIADIGEPLMEQKRTVVPLGRVIEINYEPA